jgi:hypothetical protein
MASLSLVSGPGKLYYKVFNYRSVRTKIFVYTMNLIIIYNTVFTQGPVQSFCVRPNIEPDLDPSTDCCKNSSASANSLCFVDKDRTTSHCLRVRASLETSSVCNTTASHCVSPLLCLHPGELKCRGQLM